jgi:hypothetical protein
MKAGTPFFAGEMWHLKRGRPKLVVHKNELSSSHKFSVEKKNIFICEINKPPKVFFLPLKKITCQLMVVNCVVQDARDPVQFFETQTTPVLFHPVDLSSEHVDLSPGVRVVDNNFTVDGNVDSLEDQKVGTLGGPLTHVVFVLVRFTRAGLVKNLPLTLSSLARQQGNPEVGFELKTGQGVHGIEAALKTAVSSKVKSKVEQVGPVKFGEGAVPQSACFWKKK